jgi:hypothetical protein
MNLIKRSRKHLATRSLRRQINQDILKMANLVAKAAPKPDDQLTILSFNASTRITGLSLNAAFALLTGWSLRLQGARVINFVCHQGMTRCVMGTNRSDVYQLPPCRQCLMQSKVIYAHSNVKKFTFSPNAELAELLKDTELANLYHFRYEDIPLGQLCLPSMRWVLRRHHLEDDEPTRVLYRYFILSAYKVAMQFDWQVITESPQAVTVFNGMFFPEATARWVAHQRDVPVFSHEVGLRPFSAFFTAGEATAYQVEIPESFQLTPVQDTQLDEYLSQRFRGDFSMAGIQFWPEMTGLDAPLVEKIEAFRQIVPIFTNVIFDTSQPHANVIFQDMFAWLDEVLKVIKVHPETLFVIRAHPDESRPGKASQESVAAWVQNQEVESLPNVIFVGPDEYFSSYEMIQKAKFVMIYNSTIGMEAVILGAPVLCAGKARFTQLETVFFPKSQAEYLARLEEFLGADKVHALEQHRVNARRFLYFQLFRTSLSFDRYLEADGILPGFVRLKDFAPEDLLPERSPALKAISDGLLHGGEFLLPN